MNSIRRSLIALALIGASASATAQLVVVANPGVSFNTLPRAELNRLFLGITTSYPDGSAAAPIDAKGEDRNTFDVNILKRTPDQMYKYWARMIFSGKALPPREVDARDVKSVIAQTPGAIGYLDSSQVDGSVKVIAVQ